MTGATGRAEPGHTWWGRAWVDALEQRARLDPNRLPRGRDYARSGSVGELVLAPGEVRARVQGRKSVPYEVRIRVRRFADDEWDQVLEAISAQLGHAAAMLDGDLTTGWSNYYNKSGTANLHAVSVSHASEWVSVSWPDRQEFSAITVFFTLSSTLSLPASISVTYWDGHDFVPVKNLQIVMATASNQPTTLTFDRVHTGQVRLTMTSPTPGTGTGFLRIAELQVLSNGTNIA